MSFLTFIRENLRWLAGGFLLTFFSSYGQTFFISLSAGHIRDEYGLSNGGWGLLYMIATLASAATMPRFGRIVDRYSVTRVTSIIVPVLALACLLMAVSRNIVLLGLTIYLLRLFGQGMMAQNAFTAIGRWFASQRGKAIALSAIGVNTGEASMPFLFVLTAGALGWRNAWLVAAATLLVVALPVDHLAGARRARAALQRPGRQGFAQARLEPRRGAARSRLLHDHAGRRGAGLHRHHGLLSPGLSGRVARLVDGGVRRFFHRDGGDGGGQLHHRRPARRPLFGRRHAAVLFGAAGIGLPRARASSGRNGPPSPSWR